MVTRLVLTDEEDELIETADLDSDRPPQPILLQEDRIYGFTLESREKGLDYAIWTGDIPLETGDAGYSGPSDASTGRVFRTNVQWEFGRYFDGARGRVQVILASREREAGEQQEWQRRLVWPVYVVSTKMTEMSFNAMCDELRHLGSGMLFDLISKAATGSSVQWSGHSNVFHHSSQVELAQLERLWDELSGVLAEIADQPYAHLAASTQILPSYGSERFGPRSLVGLSARGIDPRASSIPKPFPARRTVVREDWNTIEHQIIAGFLHFLLSRVRECRYNIDCHASAIEKDRVFRDRPFGPGVSLWESIDRPKLAELRKVRNRAEQIAEEIRASLRQEWLRDALPRLEHADTPVFRNVDSYYHFSTLMRNYLNSALLVLDDGVDQRLKSTSRMYEQWVFLQLAAALRWSGLRCTSWEGLLTKVRQFRYTLDIDRGARLTFTAADGWIVVLRFEPWIYPRHLARERGDTVCREGGTAAWSPDVLIEFCREPEAGRDDTEAAALPKVHYAVVVDAKYTRRITSAHRERVGKYLDIRETASGRQVVRQMWLAAPCQVGDEEIVLRDPALAWTSAGPSCGREEQIDGDISLIPSVAADTDDEGSLEPNEVAIRFMEALMNYVGVHADTAIR